MLEVVGLVGVRGGHCLFNGLSFTLEKGEFLCVRGPNGAGKTTLLRTLCGLSSPEAGEVRWQGEDVRRLGEDFHREVSYVGHLSGVKDELTVWENLKVAGQLAQRKAEDQLIWQALTRMGLDICVELPGRRLSQGQRRRLALARLLISGSRLWILDEPFTALDVAAVGSVEDMVKNHLDGGGIAVLTTHQDIALISQRARHIQLGM